MGLKHRLKTTARGAWARVVFHTGLHRLLDHVQPRRLTILAGHCVRAPSSSTLPADMTIAGEKLERILSWLKARYDVVTVAEGVERLESGTGRSLVALTMDDGYADNRTHLLPLLAKVGVPATIYLESRPLDQRVPNWSHKFFAVLDKLPPADFVRRFTARSSDARSNALLSELVTSDRATSYHVKRVLKYEVPAAERSRVVDTLFAECGGDERALAERLYMSWDDARALRDAGVELGGHTVHHEILSRLDERAAREEIEGSKRALERELGGTARSFAYPFGRNWDWNDQTVLLTRAAGWRSATTTHAGTNKRGDDPYRLKRIMIDEHAQLHVLATHACGGFDWLARFGIRLAE